MVRASFVLDRISGPGRMSGVRPGADSSAGPAAVGQHVPSTASANLGVSVVLAYALAVCGRVPAMYPVIGPAAVGRPAPPTTNAKGHVGPVAGMTEVIPTASANSRTAFDEGPVAGATVGPAAAGRHAPPTASANMGL